SDELFAVWGSGPNDVYAVGENGVILHDTGTWIGGETLTGENLYGLWGTSASNVLAVGYYETDSPILYQGSYGAFTPSSTSFTGILDSVWSPGADDIYVLGSTSVYHTTDGSTWPSRSLPGALARVWGSSATDVYVIGLGGTGGVVYHSSDGGANWSSPTLDDAPSLFGVWGSSATDIYVVGDKGTILHSADGGETFTAQTSGTTQPLFAVWGSSASDVYAVGGDATILHTSDRGATWVSVYPIDTSGDTSWRGVWGSSATDVYVVGTGGAIVHGHD
ncbi:MAG TPA: hypothetical protein VLX92_19455, partial [Kofleriaceae bacterium]|nr:hypothetical protein [Kofleriaceae bacterium]